MKTSFRFALMALAITGVTIAAAGPLPAHVSGQAQTQHAAAFAHAAITPVAFRLN